jgi:putative transposase
MATKRNFSSEFKCKIVLELLKEERTLGEIAQEHEINPNQLSTWRREFLEKASNIFNDTKDEKARKKAEKEAAAEKDQLLKTIGQLTMERDFLQAVQKKQDDKRRLL